MFRFAIFVLMGLVAFSLGSTTTQTIVTTPATGAAATTGAASNATTDAAATTGAPSNATTGAAATTGAPSNATTGAAATTGASQPTTGAASNATTGAASQPTTDSAATSGASNATTDASKATTGATQPTTSGASKATTGPTTGTTGASNSTSETTTGTGTLTSMMTTTHKVSPSNGTCTGTSCEDCVGIFDDATPCVWCSKTNVCSEAADIKEDCDACDSDHCFARTCKITRKLLLVIVFSTVFAILLFVGVWIYCCCRRRRNRKLKVKKLGQYETSEFAEDQARSDRQATRRAERSLRTDEIRRKYGLLQNESDDDDEMMDL